MTIDVGLTGIPETMLWTLHNRSSEAARPDGIIRDERALAVRAAISYDYERSFGRAEPSHAYRSLFFDERLRRYLREHPDGVVVNLGEGLETQRFRVAERRALWITVDVPEAIAARERFIAPDDGHRHVPLSALDRVWFDAVPRDKPVYLTAQGLLMYFPETEVRSLFIDLARRFPGARFAFDTAPRWFSKKTMRGMWWTRHYRTPPMPWGIDRHEIAPALSAWVPGSVVEENRSYVFPRGLKRYLFGLVCSTPLLRRITPGIVVARFPEP